MIPSAKFLECTLLLVEVLLIQSEDKLGYACENDLQLIVGLPREQDREPAASWERGSEILAGVQLAVDSINNRSDVLPGHKLHTAVVDVGRCGVENYNFLLQIINLTYYQNNITFIGAVGIFCPTEVQIFAQLPDKFHDNVSVAKTKANLKLAIEATNNGREVGKQIPVSNMVKALLDFLEVMDWRNVAAITDSKDNVFSHFVEMLHIASAKDSSNITITAVTYSYASSVSHLNLSRITIISVHKQLVEEILCSAYKEDMMWPKHVWILHTYQLEDLKFNRMSCAADVVLEKVIIINEKVPIHFAEMVKYSEKQLSKLDINSYSVILHNLIWLVALQVNKTIIQDRLRTPKNPLPNQFLKKQIVISQVRNFTTIPVAHYQPDEFMLNLSDQSFKVNAPSDELLIITVGGSEAYTAVFVTEIVAFFAFVTIMLSCYGCFRREPEVKSTSFSLSLLMFLGCYIMFLYLSLLVYFHQPWPVADETLNGLCISLTWFSGLGITTGLLVTTALVKILRIYYIFTKHSATRLSPRCSDTYLALYVVLILLPLIFILALRAIVDPHLGYVKVTSGLNIIRIQKQCRSKYAMLWYALLTTYISTILIILLVVAIKTRRIQKSHFRDTKKVTIFVISYLVNIVVTLTFWRIIYTNVNAYYAAIVVHIGHITAILLCQLILFAPKVLPPFARYISKRRSI